MTAEGRITYTDDLADKICVQIASGVNLAKVCEQKDMPGHSTVYQWLRKYPDFTDKYARAKRLQLDYMVDEVINLADGLDDYAPNSIAYNNRRLQIDTRKWFISKLAPKIPALSGSYKDQARQIIAAFSSGNLNEEMASSLMQLLNAEAAFVPLDIFKSELQSLRKELTEIKNNPKQ